MRIIGGQCRGGRIKAMAGLDCRPAMGRVRGAIFSALEARGIDWPSCRALDLFAGSGSLGLEALSRGAAQVSFVEVKRSAAALIDANALRLGFAQERLLVLAEEARRFLSRVSAAPYDLIFIDPPYGQGLLAPTLRAVLRNNWLKEGALLNVELESRLKFNPQSVSPFLTPVFDRLYGQTRVVLWNRKTQDTLSIPAPLTPSPTGMSA